LQNLIFGTHAAGHGRDLLAPSEASITGKLAARAGLRRRGALHPAPCESRGEVARLRSASLFGRACAVRASLRHVPTCGGEAESHAEAALLRLIEALIQRFLGIGQAPQVPRPDGQRIGATAQTLGRIGTLPGSASCLAPRDPLLADVTERLLDRGPVLLLGGRQLQRGLDCRDAGIGKRRDVIGCQLRTLRPLGWSRLLS
jgi:hypothetical protein